MCRFAEDLPLMFKIMAGEQSISRHCPKLLETEPVDFRNIKIYYMDGIDDPLMTPVDQEIRIAIRLVAKHFFNQYGTETKKVALTKFKDSFEIFMNSYKMKGAEPLAATMTQGQGELNLWFEMLKSIVGLSNHTLPVLIVALIEKLKPDTPQGQQFAELGQLLKRELHKLLADDGIFLFPTHPEVAPKHKTTILKMNNTAYTSIFNILEVPITQCPLGLNKDGLPMGVQVVGAPYNDHLTLAVAKELERKFGGWVPPCKIDARIRKDSKLD
jgi:fatty acid amide hydrolase 2